MEFGSNIVKFNLFDAMKHPNEEHFFFALKSLANLIVECIDEFTTYFPNLSSYSNTYICDFFNDGRICFVCHEIEFVFPNDNATIGTKINNTMDNSYTCT